MNIWFLLLGIWQTFTYEVMFAINCGTYTQSTVSTKYFNYTVVNKKTCLASVMETKNTIPQSLTNQADKQIIKHHRTTSQGYSNFSYRPVLSENGYYLAIITMIQTEFKQKGERIFHIKLGDQIIHTVDIVAQVGFGKILHKWIEFELRQDIAYINGTVPALNAFNYKSRQIILVFDSAKNKPKIQTLMFLKGADSHQYLRQFLQYQQQKSIKIKQYVAQKYRKQPKLSYRPLLASDIILPPQSQFQKFYNKFITFRSLGSILCGIFAVHFQKIITFFKNRFNTIIDKLKTINKNLWGKKKIQ